MKKKIYNWFIRLLANRFGDDIVVYLSNEMAQREWYKARRAGYKKSEMGFYYSDLADGRNNDLGRWLN